jgi:N-acyl-D-amino-acid deacylase
MIRLDQDRNHADEQQRGALRRQIRRELETTTGWENWYRHVGFDWQRILLGHTEHARYRAAVGQSIAALAEQFQQDPWDVFFELLRAGAFVLPESMNEDNKILAMQQDFMAFCTDVGPADGASYAAHPRAYGAFPRLLARYVREKQVISLEQAIAQATSVAARHVKLSDRGRIAVGQAADLVLFDPETVADQATFAQPDQLSTGITQVLVNGQVVYENGQLTTVRPGRVLRGPGWRPEQRPAAQRDSANLPTLAAFDELGRQFLERHAGVGLAIAVTDQGRLVHAAGYGYADLAQSTPVTPQSLFRIASVSKPITALAILKLREQGQLELDDPILQHLALEPAIAAAGDAFDARWRDITIRHLLEHRGGWDRQQSFDAMFRSVDFAQSLGLPPPAAAVDVIHAMLRHPLDFDPGERYAYSNLGYNLLGRIIEHKTGQAYDRYVNEQVLTPLGIRGMRLGRTRLAGRQANEVRYYHPGVARSVFAEDLDQDVPSPYGAWHLEAMDAHGGWLASAVDLARLAAALDDPTNCPILSADSLAQIHQRPPGAAGYNGNQPKDVYYGLGWQVRSLPEHNGQASWNLWHSGSLPGTATILIRRHDGRNFVALLNSRVGPTGTAIGSDIDASLHRAAAEVAEWPNYDLFPQLPVD